MFVFPCYNFFMLNNLSNYFLKNRKRSALIFSSLVFFFFSLCFLPGQTRLANTYSSGLGAPDAHFLYTPADLYRMAEVYGREGRTAYVKARWTFDLAFPIIYTSFLTIALSWFEERVLPVGSEWRTANVLPLFAMLFDLLENSCTTLVFIHYPAPSTLFCMAAPFFTLVKWVCVGSSFLLLVLFMIGSLFVRYLENH